MEPQTIEAPAAVKKPAKRKARGRAKPVAKAAPSEFPGLSPADCCSTCSIEGCVITGRALCGHPRKGGLQEPDMNRKDVLARYNRAVKALAHQDIERKQT